MKTLPFRSWLTLARAAVACLLVVGSAHAAPPAPLTIAGTIVYSRGNGVTGGVWLAAGDGSSDVPITQGALPRLAPDGRHLLIRHGADDGTRGDVWVRDLVSGNETLVVPNTDYVVGTSWLPDSTRIFFDQSCGIYRRDADGSNQATLIAVDCYDDAPSVSPLGGRLAFHNVQPGRGLLLANLDGSGRAVIPNTGGTGNGSTSDVWPAWSADGAWIGFGNGLDLYKIRPDGTGRTNLTANTTYNRTFSGGGSSLAPAWTPDGQWLVAPMNVDGVNALYAVKADGSGELRKLPTRAGEEIAWIDRIATTVSYNPATHAETDLRVAAPTFVAVGKPFEYTLTVRNFGPLATSGLVLTNPIPAGIGAVSATTPSGTATSTGGNVVVKFAPLAPGASATVHVTATATTNGFPVLTANTIQGQPDATFDGTATATVTAIVGTVGRVSVPGERDTYAFTVAGGTRLFNFDSLVDSDRLAWRLDGPSGPVVNDAPFRYADGDRIGDNVAVQVLSPGDYILTVRCTDETVADYAFHYIDLASATLVATGTTNTAALAPANSTAVYQFVAAAGDHVSVDLLSRDHVDGFRWRLVNPKGVVVAAAYFQSSSELVLAEPGNHFLLLEGSVSNPGAGTVTFAVTPHGSTPPPPPGGTPLAFGAFVHGTNLLAGDVARYLVHADHGMRFLFDVMGPAQNFNWNLRGTGGTVVDHQPFYYSYYHNNSFPTFVLAAGDYELDVTGTAGEYRFRLVDFAATAPLALGSEISVTNTPVNSVVLLRFDGVAGQRIYQANGTSSGYQYAPFAYYYSPLGNQMGTYYTANDASFVLPMSGTYTVAVGSAPEDASASGITRFTLLASTDTSETLAVGTVATNHIDVAGRQRAYRFNLPADRLLYFDNLGPQAGLNWTLDGPTGRIINTRGFWNSDSYYGYSAMALVAGDYTLTVAGNAQNTGAYSFRLLDAASGKPAVAGTDIGGTLNPGNSTEIYQINLVAGQGYYLDIKTPADGYCRLLDPLNRVLVETYLSNDRGTFIAPITGTYYFFVEGSNAATSPTPYLLQFRPVFDGTSPLTAFDVPVTGAVTSAGQTQRHTFTLTQTRLLYFDSLTNQNAVYWNLDGPAGRYVGQRRFTSSDGVNGFTPLLLGPGDYTISVAGDGDNTGGYAFRLLDTANATAITPNVRVDDALPLPNATRAYRFDALAGQRFYLDFLAGTNTDSTYYRLVDPLARSIAENYVPNDRGPFSVPLTGRYVLFVEGWIGAPNPAGYGFAVRSVSDGSQSLVVGATVNGNIDGPGQIQSHTFKLAASRQIYFDSLASRDDMYWSLDGPRGRVVNGRGLGNTDSDHGFLWLDLPAGDYTISVSANADAVGPYSFRLLDLAVAPAFVPGTGLSGNLTPANRTDAYRFQGTAGSEYTRQSSGDNAYIRVVDPLGRVIDGNYLSNFGGNASHGVLPLDGTYTVLVEGYNRATIPGPYTLNLVPAGGSPPPPFNGSPLAFDTVYTGTLATAADTTNYVFTVAGPRKLAFDTLNTSQQNWRITGRQGNVTGDRTLFYSDWYAGGGRLIDLPPGSYQLTVFGTAGTYAFQLRDVQAAPVLPIGTVVNGTNTPAVSESVWQFQGVAGQRYYFRGLGFLGLAPRTGAKLFDPDNQNVLSLPFDQDADVFALPKSGPYTFIADRSPDDASAQAAYSFEFLPVSDATGALVIGQTVADSIATPGQRRSYTFNLPAAKVLSFDSLTNLDYVTWTLDGPSGRIVNDTPFLYSDYYAGRNLQYLALAAGAYTLTVDAYDHRTPDYSFRLLDYATSTPFVPGNPVTNTATPANGSTLLSFDAAAGQRFYYHGMPRDGFSRTPNIAFFAPSGQFLYATSVDADTDAFTAPATGNYHAIVMTPPDDTAASGTYRFNLIPIVDTTEPLAVGQIVSGNFDMPGQLRYYTFDVASRSRISLDTLGTETRIRVTLDGPAGRLLDGNLYYIDAYSDANYFDCPPGHYTLTLDADGGTTPAFRFRILDLAQAVAFTPGIPVNATITPAAGTVMFTFLAQAGDRFYFDGLGQTGFAQAPYARLYGPYGGPIQRQSVIGNIDTFAVPATGAYYWIVTAYPGETGTAGTIAFNLVPNPPLPPIGLFEQSQFPDMVVDNPSATPANTQSGGTLSVSWTVRNAGTVGVTNAIADRVTVRNGVGTLLANKLVPAATAIFAAGGTANRSTTVALPAGPAATGTLEVTVTTDALSAVPEQNGAGTGEANNAASTTVQSVLAPYPDLQVASLAATPAGGWQPGSTVTLHWTLTNSGTLGATGPWAELVVVSNITKHVALLSTTTNFTGAALSPATGVARVLAFVLPNDANAYGDFVVTVATDTGNAVAEYNAADTGESNNAASIALESAPDLAVASIVPPANAIPGVPINLVYVLTNKGNVTITGTWLDQLLVADAGDATTLHTFDTHFVTATIPPAGFLRITNSVTFAANGEAGTLRFSVRTDAASAIAESDETNNELASAATTTVPLALSVQLFAHEVHENANPPAVTAAVTRNGSRTADLSVHVLSGDTSRATVPPLVTIPAGQASANFSVIAVPDGIVTPPRPVSIGVSAIGFSGASDTLSVLNDDTTLLALSIAPNRVIEGHAATATVTRTPVDAAALVVQVIASDPAQVGTPGTVTIPAGSASATFVVTTIEDTLVERTNTYTVTATATGFPNAAASFTIEDNDIPNVVISLASRTISEGAGPNATSATVTRTPVSNRALVVALSSSDPSSAKVAASVVIPAGQASASVPVAAVNNTIVDGTRQVVIGGSVLDSVNSTPVRDAAPDLLAVTDDDGPTLGVKLADDVVPEGRNPATTGTVTRNTVTTAPLVVSLASSLTTEATVPPTVTIPAGSASAVFNIASINDHVTDGNKSVAIVASATGYTPGTATLVVSDSDLPDLVVASIAFPATAVAGGQLTATFRVENRGVVAATGAIVQRVFLSTDNVVGGDLLVSQLSYPGPLPAGQFFEQTVNIHLPDATGNYWVIVTTDANNDVVELLENNNTRVSTDPVAVGPAYTATVQTDVTTALAGTAVPLHGSAVRAGSGVPAANVPVTVHLQVRGITRTLAVLTGPDGKFNTVFQPLPGEAGHYTIAAAYPGLPMPAVQDNFVLVGFSIAQIGLVNVVEGSAVAGSTKVSNLSELPLTGMSVSVVAHHPSIAVTASLSTNTLPGSGELTLTFGVSAVDTSAAQSSVQLRVTSAEGASVDLLFNVRQERLLPRLVANPGSLATTMRRGGQSTVVFNVTNNGGRDTGPLDVVVPTLPWLSLASIPRLNSLPPGSNTTVTVLLSPAADMAFGEYTGTLVLQSSNANLAVPYAFRPISESKGNLFVVAEDEYTYFAAGAPRVTNAVVTISDALTGTPVSTNYTGLDGGVLITNLNEAFYIVDVRAPAHGPFRDSALVVAGQTTNVTAFLTRETVHYSFTVVPTTIEDHYSFTVDSTFETQVPVPVVTLEPASIDLAQYAGTDFQFDLTVANHGLINAQSLSLVYPSTDRLQITPLVTNIGTLPGNTSLTIPILVHRITPPGLTASRGGTALPTDYKTGTCSVTATMLWNYLCGPNVVNKSTASYAFDSTGCDLVDLYRQVYDIVPDNPGTGGGASSFFDDLEQLNTVSDFEAPPGFHFQCKTTPPGTTGHAAPASALPAAGNEVCAKVKLTLNQKAVLTRDAFKATLELDNESDSALQSVLVTLNVKNSNGDLVTQTFGIHDPTLTGFTTVDGTGGLDGHTSGTAEWILLPSLDAAPQTGSSFYLVGGTLSYVQDGAQVTIPLAPAPIQVYPQPELIVRYFHDRDVFSDDPFTPEVEPSLPYSLGMQVQNVGYGPAHSLKITGGKPQIVENQKGLLIEFKLIGTQIENQSATPSLDVDFGEIGSATNKIARWLFTSRFQGSFTNFSASFSHTDALGSKRLSLVRSTEIHELNHIVNADRTFDDGRPDFLANDAPDPDLLPDTLYLSDGTSVPVTAVVASSVAGTLTPGNLRLTATATMAAGWSYLRLKNPGIDGYELRHVRRADGSELAFGTNVWLTDRLIRGGDLRPIRTNLVHLLDYNSTGTYTLDYAVVPGPVVDTAPPVSQVATLPAITSRASFAVRWDGNDGIGGSGIATYDVFVSVDGGPFTKWQDQTALQAAVYPGANGHHYAFFSVATDVAGNREDAHPAADTATSVDTSNHAPTLSFAGGGIATVNEGDLARFAPTAADIDSNHLTFALLPGAPAGVVLDPTTGAFRWQTTESDGPGTYNIQVRVTDDGVPALSADASLKLTVRELNSPPQISGGGSLLLNKGTLLTLPFSVFDSDLPRQTVTFSLGAGAPLGAAIDKTTGVLTWRPSGLQAPSTNHITVLATDNGSPAGVAAASLTVFVRDTHADLLVAAGHTNVFVGESNLVPLSLNSLPEVTNVVFELSVPASRIGALALRSLADDVASATLVPLGGDRSRITLDLTSGGSITTTRRVADLAFTAANVHDSTIATLALDHVVGITFGAPVSSTEINNGSIIVVGAQAVLAAEIDVDPHIILYGHPGVTYTIEGRPLVDRGLWKPIGTVTPTSRIQDIPFEAGGDTGFFRAFE